MKKLRIASMVGFVTLVVWMGMLSADDCNYLSPSQTPCEFCKKSGVDNDNNKYQDVNNDPNQCTYYKVTYTIPTVCESLDGTENCVQSSDTLEFSCCAYANCQWTYPPGQCSWDVNGVQFQTITTFWVFATACATTQ